MPSGRILIFAALLAWTTPGFVDPAAAGDSTATGASREFNPAISVNALLTARAAEETADRAYNGVDLQESEVQLSSIVDPYWKADLVFAVHPEHAHDGDEVHGSGYAGDVEVARAAAQALPGGFGLVVGKDYLPFGKHAPLHTHQFPFVDAPAAVSTFLGEHSLTETGVRLSHDLPTPWYADLTIYAVDGKSAIFDADFRDPAAGARWQNVFDLNLESTLEAGASWLHGRLAPDYLLMHEDGSVRGDLDVFGADMTWKRVSAEESRGSAVTMTGEVILPRPEEGADQPWGWYGLAQYRFARNWWIGVGAGGLDRDLPHDEDEEAGDEHAEAHAHGPADWAEVFEYKANLTWAPSEFSSLRFEAARYEQPDGDGSETLLSVQLNFTIGSHPAHKY